MGLDRNRRDDTGASGSPGGATLRRFLLISFAALIGCAGRVAWAGQATTADLPGVLPSQFELTAQHGFATFPVPFRLRPAIDPWAAPLLPTQPDSSTAGQAEQQPAGENRALCCGSETPEREVSWKRLIPNVLQDQKRIWTFPGGVVKGRHWKPAVGFAATTVGLVVLDQYDEPYFRTTTAFHGFNGVFSTSATGIGMVVMPVSFYAVSLVRHNAYDQHTSLLAAESVLDTELLEAVMKSTFRRVRPRDVPPGGNLADTFTDARGGLFGGQNSFPSGHAITAFSIATIFADRYSRHRWVPWVAYGLAAAVGFSRITTQSHFTSDVFVGAVLGYSISHYVVLQR